MHMTHNLSVKPLFGHIEKGIMMVLCKNLNMHSIGKSVYDELHAMLKLYGKLFPPKEAAHALMYKSRMKRNPEKLPKVEIHKVLRGIEGKCKSIDGLNPKMTVQKVQHFFSKPKNPPTPKMINPGAKDAICHQCGKVGHWRRNCPVYLAKLMKKKKLSQGATYFEDTKRQTFSLISPLFQQAFEYLLSSDVITFKYELSQNRITLEKQCNNIQGGARFKRFYHRLRSSEVNQAVGYIDEGNDQNISPSYDTEPMVEVPYSAEYNVFVVESQHFEQPESISNTCVVEMVDRNVIPDSSNMCINDDQIDQNAVEYD
ncbi:zinc finger, CCHC-type containing protein [Tanacetum coccineum]